MNKEIKDRLDKLENELKESKNEIHSLKSSVSLTIERGIGKLLSRFTRKQLILGSVIALFSISIIGIAGTVTKTYTFSSGEVVSASKFNTNFDTLFTLVNGNLDDNNISSLSASKITGTLDNSSLPRTTDSIILFSTNSNKHNGNYGGRSGADQQCIDSMNLEGLVQKYNNCSNVRALISVSSDDEIRDFPSIYSVPTDKYVRNNLGVIVADNFSSFLGMQGDSRQIFPLIGITKFEQLVQTGSGSDGSLYSDRNCSGWTTANSNYIGQSGRLNFSNENVLNQEPTACNVEVAIMCICF